MEENTVNFNEIEEVEPDIEVEEEENSNGGAIVAGIVGGFLAYALIGGAKKLRAFIEARWTRRKQLKDVVEAEVIEVTDAEDSDEENPEK